MVAAMATDAWQQARDAVTALWRRDHPDRAAAMEGELTAARTILLRDDNAAVTLTQLWQLRLQELLLSDERLTGDLTRELHRVAQELTHDLAQTAQPSIGSVSMNARATDGGRVYQSAGDMHITER